MFHFATNKEVLKAVIKAVVVTMVYLLIGRASGNLTMHEDSLFVSIDIDLSTNVIARVRFSQSPAKHRQRRVLDAVNDGVGEFTNLQQDNFAEKDVSLLLDKHFKSKQCGFFEFKLSDVFDSLAFSLEFDFFCLET